MNSASFQCYNHAMTEQPENTIDELAEIEEHPVKNTMVFKRSHVYSALLPLAFVAGIAAGFLFWGRGAEAAPVVVAQAAAQPQAAAPAAPDPQDAPRFDISVDDDPALGPADAPIVIIEFSDFNCGYCRKWHQETFDDLLNAYPEQIHFVYRDLPFLGPDSVTAAQAAQCADEQGKFWEYHDALFSNAYPLGTEAYASYAQELGLDATALTECIDSGRYEAEVMADYQYASNLGVNGTPTFFINGIPLVGAQPLGQFIAVIESELGG
jgi:protein-disulfide isomerase